MMVLWFALLALMCCPKGGAEVPLPIAACRAADYDHVLVLRQTLCLKGIIKPYDKLAEVLKGASVSTMVVNSPGGYAAPALDAALIMQARGIDIYVDGICASSCANYLFVAARHKYVPEHSLVLWHGSPGANDEITTTPPGWTKEEVVAFNERARRVSREQARLLQLTGVNGKLLNVAGETFFENPVVVSHGWTAKDIESDAMMGRFAWTVGPKRLKQEYGITGIRQMWYPDVMTLYAYGKTVLGDGFSLIALAEPQAGGRHSGESAGNPVQSTAEPGDED